MRARQGLRQIPNLISVSRLVMAVAFVAIDTSQARIMLVALAALTDFLDGYIARRARITSRAGAFIDPISDRVFVLTAVATFLYLGQITTVGYFVVILRDLMTAVGFLVARTIPWLRPIKFRARNSGKVVTSLQLLTFAAILVRPAWVPSLIAGVFVASCWAVYDYTMMLWRERERAA